MYMSVRMGLRRKVWDRRWRGPSSFCRTWVSKMSASTWSPPTTSTSIRGQYLVTFYDQHIHQVSTWSPPTTSTSIRSKYLVTSYDQYIHQVNTWSRPTTSTWEVSTWSPSSYHQYINQVSTWSHTTSTSIRSVPGHMPPVHQSEVSTWLPPTTSTS